MQFLTNPKAAVNNYNFNWVNQDKMVSVLKIVTGSLYIPQKVLHMGQKKRQYLGVKTSVKSVVAVCLHGARCERTN